MSIRKRSLKRISLAITLGVFVSCLAAGSSAALDCPAALPSISPARRHSALTMGPRSRHLFAKRVPLWRQPAPALAG